MRLSQWIPAAAIAATRHSRVYSLVTKRSNRSITYLATRLMSTRAPLIDVDCNLWHKDLISLQTLTEQEESPLSILQEDAVKESNIVAMVSPSSTLEEARRGLNVLSSESVPHIPILTTVGVHPYHVNDEGVLLDDDLSSMKELISHERVCAVGECGLDASEGFPPLEQQVPWFQAQVELAQEYQKPLFVHERGAFDQTMHILQDVTVPVIIHCFTGTRQECIQYIERGYSLSVSGFILRNEGDDVCACLREGLIPLNRLMLETDAPYMGFEACRSLYLEKHADYAASLNSKKRKRLQNSIYPNVPSSLSLVLDEVVKLINEGRTERGEAILERDNVARITTENAIRFFGFEGIEL